MHEVKNKYTGKIVYFWFFASQKYPECFWYTKQKGEAEGFELGTMNDYEPIATTWQELRK